MAKKALTRKVEIGQKGNYAMFRLSEKEYQSLRKSSIYTAIEPIPSLYGRCYNFSMFAFFDYETSRSKSGRFHKKFNYFDGDFSWRLL